jgi:uncharacterized membrane protein
MLITVVVAIATLWLGVMAVLTFKENPKAPNEQFLYFLASCALLAVCIYF